MLLRRALGWLAGLLYFALTPLWVVFAAFGVRGKGVGPSLALLLPWLVVAGFIALLLDADAQVRHGLLFGMVGPVVVAGVVLLAVPWTLRVVQMLRRK